MRKICTLAIGLLTLSAKINAVHYAFAYDGNQITKYEEDFSTNYGSIPINTMVATDPNNPTPPPFSENVWNVLDIKAAAPYLLVLTANTQPPMPPELHQQNGTLAQLRIYDVQSWTQIGSHDLHFVPMDKFDVEGNKARIYQNMAISCDPYCPPSGPYPMPNPTPNFLQTVELKITPNGNGGVQIEKKEVQYEYSRLYLFNAGLVIDDLPQNVGQPPMPAPVYNPQMPPMGPNPMIANKVVSVLGNIFGIVDNGPAKGLWCQASNNQVQRRFHDLSTLAMPISILEATHNYVYVGGPGRIYLLDPHDLSLKVDFTLNAGMIALGHFD